MEYEEFVKRVIDGDTFETEGGRPPVRLLNVYSPEPHEHLGQDAHRRLIQLLGDKVTVDVVGYDRYGRRLAWVECNGISVNRAMKDYLEAQGLVPPAGWLKNHTRPGKGI